MTDKKLEDALEWIENLYGMADAAPNLTNKELQHVNVLATAARSAESADKQELRGFGVTVEECLSEESRHELGIDSMQNVQLAFMRLANAYEDEKKKAESAREQAFREVADIVDQWADEHNEHIHELADKLHSLAPEQPVKE